MASFKVMLSARRSVEVASLAEASRAVRAYIEQHDLGAGCSPHAPAFTGGAVLQGGKPVARISYNGRIWTLGGEPLEG